LLQRRHQQAEDRPSGYLERKASKGFVVVAGAMADLRMLGSKQSSRGAPLRARSAQSRSRSRFHIHAAYKLTPKDSGSSSSSIRAFTIGEMTAATVGSDSGKCDIVLPAE